MSENVINENEESSSLLSAAADQTGYGSQVSVRQLESLSLLEVNGKISLNFE